MRGYNATSEKLASTSQTADGRFSFRSPLEAIHSDHRGMGHAPSLLQVRFERGDSSLCQGQLHGYHRRVFSRNYDFGSTPFLALRCLPRNRYPVSCSSVVRYSSRSLHTTGLWSFSGVADKECSRGPSFLRCLFPSWLVHTSIVQVCTIGIISSAKKRTLRRL